MQRSESALKIIHPAGFLKIVVWQSSSEGSSPCIFRMIKIGGGSRVRIFVGFRVAADVKNEIVAGLRRANWVHFISGAKIPRRANDEVNGKRAGAFAGRRRRRSIHSAGEFIEKKFEIVAAVDESFCVDGVWIDGGESGFQFRPIKRLREVLLKDDGTPLIAEQRELGRAACYFNLRQNFLHSEFI